MGLKRSDRFGHDTLTQHCCYGSNPNRTSLAEIASRYTNLNRRYIYLIAPTPYLSPDSNTMRSVWKGPFFVPFPAVKAGEPVKTMARASTILPSHVGRKFLVHNGKDYIPVLVTEQMVNRKLGEFAFTRKSFSFKKKDDKRR
ncbi:mitochondrial 37S ribosomal protein RSM19 [Spizellomyces punctatus DAOM BR117]|uniref:Ribosomal protein S19 n=1 Tax=Spizellomyces punctatus (strain DAOM BR117) TaxID=645134 RepID=A0A0L0H6A4_SPIPD|nr:mitochondrial 37S ribosomal protein RSM19 [Spizellomyces punctatus DAOM BR117]KNC96248.1 hypothetical protein SPPG_09534 [Spizellomyces punctatus DAOM BR117]|eukprot:XP_016604288.1 hypothetical protein SPPG_09534 [Spizellomyces punctatus DAOM BR117]